MTKTPNAPGTVRLEFLDAQMSPVRLIDLGRDFHEVNRIDQHHMDRPFQVAIERKTSKAGNAFYEYSQNGVPLPSGLFTFLKIEGVVVPFGKVRPSKKGYPTREGTTDIVVGGVLYKVTAYLTEGRSPFYVKVIAHKKPEPGDGFRRAQMAPKGGKIFIE